MKKTLHLLSALAMIITGHIASAQLINQGFETWTNDLAVPTAMNPNSGNGTTGWIDFNYFNYAPMGSSPISVEKCSDTVHNGTYSARIETQTYTQTSWNIYKNWGIPFIGHIYSDTLGILFNGNMNELNTTYEPGIPFTQRISQFSFYYQYKPNGNDTAECRVQLVQARTPIAGGWFKTNVATGVSGWQLATINLTYVSSATPDTLWILFSASSLDHNPKPGSVLWIDDAAVSLATGVSGLHGNGDDVEIYPNPTNGMFTIREQSGFGKQQTIEIYNVLGEQVYAATANKQSSYTIDLTHSPKGIYFVKLNDGEKIRTRKIVVQ